MKRTVIFVQFPSFTVFVLNVAVTTASAGKGSLLDPSCNSTMVFISASESVSPCFKLIIGRFTTFVFCCTSTGTSSVLPSGYVTSTVTYFLPAVVVTAPLFFNDVLTPPSRVASGERFGTDTEFLILSKSELLIFPILFTATGVVPAVGVYLSFCSLTSTLNLTVVTFDGSVLSLAFIVTVFSSTLLPFSTTPVIVWLNGFVSVALSLLNQTSLFAFGFLLNQIPFGIPLPRSSLILPVLSEAFTVISAFSPRYTVTFGKFASGVDSESVVSWLFCTNLTTGLTLSVTLKATGSTLFIGE